MMRLHVKLLTKQQGPIVENGLKCIVVLGETLSQRDLIRDDVTGA